MDPAQAYVLAASRNQDAMNAVIDRFDSPVQQFYSNATIFLTGGSGFLGKQLIEKLFRSCKIKKIYMLIRQKKGKTIEERLQAILKDPVYDVLRQKQPDFASKIVPMEGDSREKLLGLSERDRRTILEEVGIFIHMAATIRFDEPIREATLVNVRGTMEVIELAKKCAKLKNFIYVSTAYTHATYSRADKDVLEQFYPCPMPPAALVQMAESMEEDRLNNITPSLLQDWPNTYAFTKALAEEAVRTMGADLPICIVRPSIVISSYREPIPAWLDLSTMFGPSGVMVAIVLGVLRVFKVDVTKRLSFVPVDYVNNAILAAGWDSTQMDSIRKDSIQKDSAQKGSSQMDSVQKVSTKMDSTQMKSNLMDSTQKEGREKEIPIYNVASIDSCVTWKFLHDTTSGVRYTMSSPKAVWYCDVVETANSLFFYLLSWIFHLIPAYIVDGIDSLFKFKPKNVPKFVSIYKKIDTLALVFHHFLFNEWHFRNYNTVAMMSRMCDADKAIYNCDLSSLDLKKFVELWLLGARKYLIKDGLEGTLKAVQKQKILFYLNLVVMVVYFCVLTYVVCTFVKLIYSLCY